MATCPAGHTSESTDYCDICGSPMDAPAAGRSPASGSAVAEGQKTMGVVCPNCGVMNAPGALFCEACGYDYTTGTMPQRPDPLSVLDLDTPVPAPDTPPTAAPAGPDATGTRGTPGTPDAPGTLGGIDTSGWSQPKVRQPEAPPPSATPPAASALDIDTPAPTGPPAASPAPAAPGPVAAGTPQPPAGATAPDRDTFDWVVEIWIDPEWYAMQQSPDPMPSPGLPDIMPLRKSTILIGRPSRSRNIHPDIDCEPDTGISRRQAELSTDGTRWFIEDLNSANGTYVAEAAGGLPSDPIPSGRRRELDGDERIYLGAWTRLVLRRATPEEQAAYASV